MSNDLLSAALAAIRAGVSIIPIDHRDKRPAANLLPRSAEGKATWKPYQERIASEDEVRRWFAGPQAAQAFAVVCGKVSGGLLVLDFDAPEFCKRWADAVGDSANGLPAQQTGGGGYQVLLRCPDPGGNDKLAWAFDGHEATGRTIAIETRGEGGYAVVAPSLHPSGNQYKWLARDAASVPLVSQEHAEKLLAAARALDEAPHTRQEAERLETQARDAHEQRHAHRNGQASVIDAFNVAHPIESLLERHGYTKGSGGRYVRPGGKSASVSVKDGRSCHWSSDDPLNDGRGKGGCGCHDAFDLYAYFEHGGDVSKAVKATAQRLGLNSVNSVSGTETPRLKARSGGFADGDPRHAAQRPTIRALEPYRPFPVDVLPAAVSRFINEGAKAMGCDPSYIALPLLAMLAAAIGNSRRIRLKSSWTEPPVLWPVIVADSGTLKSPAFDLALHPARHRQKRAMKDYERAKAEYLHAREQYDEQLKAWRRAKPEERGERPEEPQAPVCERLWCSDTTVEALADRLSLAPKGLLVARDELSGWLSSFNQYRAGQGGDVAYWLEMHRAGHLLVDRKTGDKTTIYVPRAAVCLTGGIQPDTLRRCLTPEFFENGLAARLLLAMPPRRPKRWIEAEINDATLQAVADLYDELLTFQPSPGSDGDPEPADVKLTDEAKAAWVAFYNAHAQEQAELGGGELAAAWSKLEGYAARLALVVHCVRQAGNGDVDAWHVDAESIAAGVTLAEWFGNETKRVYAAMGESSDERHVRELAELIQSMGGRVSVRNLCQRRRRYRNDPATAQADLQGLADAGLGRWEHPAPSAQGGRPRELFALAVSKTPPQQAGSGAGVNDTPDSGPANGGSDDVDSVDAAPSDERQRGWM